MSKYRVGDKVIVRDDLKLRQCYVEDIVVEEMVKFKGQVVTISKVHPRSYGYKYFIAGCPDYYWTDEMFEGLASANPLPQLETGMVLELDNGHLMMVFKNVHFNKTTVDYAAGTYEWWPLEKFDVEGVAKGEDQKYTISKIYIPCYGCELGRPLSEMEKVLIWERAVKKMTVSEIREALGYAVGIVGE